jgi:hypothetical protein
VKSNLKSTLIFAVITVIVSVLLYPIYSNFTSESENFYSLWMDSGNEMHKLLSEISLNKSYIVINVFSVTIVPIITWIVLLLSKQLSKTKVDFLKIKKFTYLFVMLTLIVILPFAFGFNFKTLNQMVVYIVSPTVYLINVYIVHSSLKV